MYTIGILLLGIFLFAFFWFILYAAITPFSAAIASAMTPYSGTATYPAYEFAAAFMANLWKYLLAIAVIGLILWAIIYSQRKNVEGMYQ